MIKRYHEAPLSIFEAVQAKTDGDYALVHLFEDPNIGPAYYKKFERALEDGRPVILDNSVFELGVAFEMNKFVDYIRKLKPTYYVIPDALEDAEVTVARAKYFKRHHPDLPGKSIGVVQGKSLHQMAWCYEQLHDLVDMIAFSFDLSCYHQIVSEVSNDLRDSWLSLCLGRPAMIAGLLRMNVIDTNKEHHLLGVALPQEMKAYHDVDFITSVDTSNPVVHGIFDIPYTSLGLATKKTTKLCDLISTNVTPIQWHTIEYNIEMFRRFCNEKD